MTKNEARIALGRMREMEPDDGFIPPVHEAVDRARRCIEVAETEPFDVVPNGDGGVLVKLTQGAEFDVMIDFRSDGEACFMVFRGSRLVVSVRVPQ